MSKLSELVGKGVRLIVAEAPDGSTAKPPATPAEREIPADAFDQPADKPPTTSAVPADVTDFAAVYEEAGIQLPPHATASTRPARCWGASGSPPWAGR